MFFRLSSLELAALVIGAALAAIAIGHLAGRSLRRRTADLHEPVGVVQTALLGFVGLILAFGLALAVGRYETRRASVVEEANAIGTTYLRAQTLAEPMRSRSLELLTDYTDTSIRLAEAVPVEPGREERACRRPDAAARALGPRGPLARRRPDRERAAPVRRDPQPDDRPADRAQGGPEQPGAAGGALVRAGERDDSRSGCCRSTWRCSTAACGRCSSPPHSSASCC